MDVRTMRQEALQIVPLSKSGDKNSDSVRLRGRGMREAPRPYINTELRPLAEKVNQKRLLGTEGVLYNKFKNRMLRDNQSFVRKKI